MIKLHPIPAFNDNYIWCFYSEGTREAVVVDPGCAKSVDNFLQSKNLNLIAILVTHHHADHTGGINTLKTNYDVKTIGFKGSRYENIDQKHSEGDRFSVLNTEFTLLEVPGHTLDHVAFYSETSPEHDQPWLFCGDTLFSGGCGRLFEGSASQMHHSLSKLRSLPGNTLVCCAHEYTLANLKFASHLMPSNDDLQDYIAHCQNLRSESRPTLPSTIEQELRINPFLRESDPEIKQVLDATNNALTGDPVEIWTEIRKAKDQF